MVAQLWPVAACCWDNAVSSAARAMPRVLSTLRDARARFVRGGKGAGIGSEGLSSRRRLVINLWSVRDARRRA